MAYPSHTAGPPHVDAHPAPSGLLGVAVRVALVLAMLFCVALLAIFH